MGEYVLLRLAFQAATPATVGLALAIPSAFRVYLFTSFVGPIRKKRMWDPAASPEWFTDAIPGVVGPTINLSWSFNP